VNIYMNFKKLVVSAAAGAVMLGAATPTFAAVNIGALNGNTTQTNNAVVVTNVKGASNTGKNLNAAAVGVQGSTTGAATTSVGVTQQVNYNSTSCGCVNPKLNVGVANGNTTQANSAFVATNVKGTSNSGKNANFALLGAQLSMTGAASTGVAVNNVVNTNVVE
jgi:hypothetical protein